MSTNESLTKIVQQFNGNDVALECFGDITACSRLRAPEYSIGGLVSLFLLTPSIFNKNDDELKEVIELLWNAKDEYLDKLDEDYGCAKWYREENLLADVLIRACFWYWAWLMVKGGYQYYYKDMKEHERQTKLAAKNLLVWKKRRRLVERYSFLEKKLCALDEELDLFKLKHDIFGEDTESVTGRSLLTIHDDRLSVLNEQMFIISIFKSLTIK
jgi:hypothetical protein